MKVRVDNPELLPDLIAALSRRIDTVVTQIADDAVEVSLLGSRTPEADIAELRQRVDDWGQGDAAVIDETT